MIPRYSPSSAGMVMDPAKGTYVAYSDYEKLRAEVAELKTHPMGMGWEAAEAARKDREAAVSRWRKAAAERDRMRALLREARSYLSAGRFRDSIDAALGGEGK